MKMHRSTFLTFSFLTFIVGEFWFRTDHAKHRNTGRKLFKKMEIKMLGQMFIQNPEVSPKQMHTSSFAAAGFMIPRFPGDI